MQTGAASMAVAVAAAAALTTDPAVAAQITGLAMLPIAPMMTTLAVATMQVVVTALGARVRRVPSRAATPRHLTGPYGSALGHLYTCLKWCACSRAPACCLKVCRQPNAPWSAALTPLHPAIAVVVGSSLSNVNSLLLCLTHAAQRHLVLLISGVVLQGAMDAAEQTRLYQQYFHDLIKFGTEGLRNLHNGSTPLQNTGGQGSVFMPVMPGGGQGAGAGPGANAAAAEVGAAAPEGEGALAQVRSAVWEHCFCAAYRL